MNASTDYPVRFFLGWLGLFLVGLIGLSTPLQAQRRYFEQQILNEADMFLLTGTYSLVNPSGDYADRFGSGYQFGIQTEYMFWPGNWILGGDFQLGFGGDVKENVLEFLQDKNGDIVGRDLALSQAFLQQRMLSGGVYVGKLIPVIKSNKRSGIRITGGIGWMRHRIRVNDEQGALPQIEDGYGKGYDRLTSGIYFSEFIGYQHISLNRRILLYGGFDFVQGMLRGRRDYDFQTMAPANTSRFDGTIGLRIGWSFALYAGTTERDIYY